MNRQPNNRFSKNFTGSNTLVKPKASQICIGLNLIEDKIFVKYISRKVESKNVHKT